MEYLTMMAPRTCVNVDQVLYTYITRDVTYNVYVDQVLYTHIIRDVSYNVYVINVSNTGCTYFNFKFVSFSNSETD